MRFPQVQVEWRRWLVGVSWRPRGVTAEAWVERGAVAVYLGPWAFVWSLPWSRALFLALGWMIGAPFAAPAQVVMRRSLFDSLGAVADTATVEPFRCVYGEQGWDRAWRVDSVTTPTILYQMPMSVGHLPCPETAKGTWHAHLLRVPGTTFRSDGTVAVMVLPPESACYLSLPDRRGREAVQLVQAGPRLACVWMRRSRQWVRDSLVVTP